MDDKAPEPVCSQGSARHAGEWRSAECEPSCLTSPWRPPERRQADRRQGSDEWVTSPRWRLPVCSGLFGQSGGKIQSGAMRCEHTLQEHVKESVKAAAAAAAAHTGLPSALRARKKRLCASREIKFVSIKNALSLSSADYIEHE